VDLAASYRACAHVTRREARNFYYAFLSLPRRRRLAIYALYAFCRASDDVVDADEPAGSSEPMALGGTGTNRTERKRAGLAALRERLTRAAAGDPDDGPDIALADAIERFGVDPADLDDVLIGMEIDLDLARVETFDELRTYCYHAASAVGLATLPILNDGVPPTDAMRAAAIDLGIGMQLVNILRDVAEDLDRGRVYLPRDEMTVAGVDEAALRVGKLTDSVSHFLADQADRADEYLARGRRLFPLLPRSGRRCPWLLAALYGRILGRIRAGGYDVFRERISLPKREKLGLLASSFWQ